MYLRLDPWPLVQSRECGAVIEYLDTKSIHLYRIKTNASEAMLKLAMAIYSHERN